MIRNEDADAFLKVSGFEEPRFRSAIDVLDCLMNLGFPQRRPAPSSLHPVLLLDKRAG